ncbi:response regulator transcription factor [Nonomuraea angiospora]|uniref:response regulator transcription factor n=1 Tax=Nonomuraea angiospora TaxID=46172 RepID=UPI00344EAA48
MSGVITIGIVDDHPIARWGLEHLFAVRSGIRVTLSVASLTELPDGELPAVILLDLYLGEAGSVLGSIPELAERAQVLVVSASSARADVLAAMRAGASGYLTKDADEDSFLTAVTTVHGKGFYLSAHLAELLNAADDSGPVLSPRERQVLDHIAAGRTSAQIARRMSLSPWTVDTYLRRIRGKYGIGNKAELTRLALELNTPPWDSVAARHDRPG